MTEVTGTLRRQLGLPLLILYGTGVTVGAGIYVLIGPVAGHAGKHAPISFLVAAIVMALTVASYAELCTRFPVAAGEAAYVKSAFKLRWLSTVTGLTMILTGVIASATVALGAAGYIAEFTNAPRGFVVAAVIVMLGLVSAWGILESVVLASLFTLLELSGLLAIILAAGYANAPIADALLAVPQFSNAAWSGIVFASLLAFFAFIGFEDLTNIVEEAHDPIRSIPLAMMATLVITTVLYVVIAAIAVTVVPLERLSGSNAPLALVFRELTGVSPAAIAAIAITATLNTILAQMTMATRVVYGMARLGDLPSSLGAVSNATATPLAATGLIVGATLVFGLLAPLERLAEWTSLTTLIVFALVNLALLKLRVGGVGRAAIHVPLILPILGLLSCVAMIAFALV